MSEGTTVYLRCISDSLYLSEDGTIGVVATPDGWQIVNAATGERMEPGVFHGSPAHAAGALARMARGDRA
jgi:hypothetical protein